MSRKRVTPVGSETKIRRVEAFLMPRRGDDGAVRWKWIVADCPFCHKSHLHKGGDLAANPFMRLGVIESNCKDIEQRKSYLLVYGGLLPVWEPGSSIKPSDATRPTNPDEWIADPREI